MTSALRRALEPIAQPAHRLLQPARGVWSAVLGSERRGGPVPVPPLRSRHPDAEPYEGGDGAAGVLLCHGSTSTPQSMRPWANHLEAAGFRVSVPLLPGHGSTWQEMNDTTWPDWYGEVDRAFDRLSRDCEYAFVTGLSMGACLCLRLAEQHAAEVAGLVLVNPVVNISDPRLLVLPVLQRLLPSLQAYGNDIALPGSAEIAYDRNPLRALHSQAQLWADVRASLEKVVQPLLIYRSERDHVVDPSSVEIIRRRVRSNDQTYVSLTRSYHVATLDYEANLIFDGSVEFFRRLVRTGNG